MSLRAVIFDYGMVLTGQPSAEAHDAMLRITGLPHDQFEAIYWADRHAYDEGKLTGLQFWQNLIRDAKLNSSTPQRLTSSTSGTRACGPRRTPAMLAWHQQLHGTSEVFAPPSFSNMGDTVLANIEREFDWLPALRRPHLELSAQDGQARSGYLPADVSTSLHTPRKRHCSSTTRCRTSKPLGRSA